MGAELGKAWTQAHGDIDGEAFDLWVEAFDGVPAARIKVGVDAVLETRNVPSLDEFMKLCSGQRSKPKPKKPASQSPLTPEQVMQRLAGIGGESQRESYERLGLHKRWGSLPPPGEWSREIRMAEELEQKSDRNKRT